MARRPDGYWRTVATYIRDNPGCMAPEVADQLGCSAAYVRAVVQRRGLKIKSRRYNAKAVERRPPQGPPMVRRMFEIADRKGMTLHALARASGVSSTALFRYHRGAHDMRVAALEACLNVLGYELAIKKRRHRAPS